jgi:hypothetical protein
VVSRAAKLLGRRLYRDRSRTSCRPRHQVGWLVQGLRPAGARRGVTRKRYVHDTKSECPSREPMVAKVREGPIETEVRAFS